MRFLDSPDHGFVFFLELRAPLVTEYAQNILALELFRAQFLCFFDRDAIVLFDEDILTQKDAGKILDYLGCWIHAEIRIDNISNLFIYENVHYLISLNQYNYTVVYEENVSEPLGDVLPEKEDWNANVYIYDITLLDTYGL